MENAPTIIWFWNFIIIIFIFMIVSLIAAIILIKKGKEQSAKGMHILGKMCLTLSIICAIPVMLVMGYVLYLSI